MERLEQLKQFANEDPGDPFNLYAMALEYQKFDPTESVRLYELLIELHPRYLPTYYPYAHLLIEQKEVERAEKVFHMGMDMALVLNDRKTLRELKSAYQDWKYNL